MATETLQRPRELDQWTTTISVQAAVLRQHLLLSEVSNQMLELYEQNRVAPPPSQGNETDSSTASIANQRAPSKVPGAADEPPNHDHHQAPRQTGHQNMSGHPHPEKPNSRIPQNEPKDGTANSNEGPNMSSTMMDAMKKINKDKVKAALEKRRKSKGDVSKKVDVMDDDDLIERELEHGVELAAEDEKIKQERRQSWPPPAHREDHQNDTRMTENTEEGELSMDSQEYRSPELDNRKRKDVHEHRRKYRRTNNKSQFSVTPERSAHSAVQHAAHPAPVELELGGGALPTPPARRLDSAAVSSTTGLRRSCRHNHTRHCQKEMDGVHPIAARIGGVRDMNSEPGWMVSATAFVEVRACCSWLPSPFPYAPTAWLCTGQGGRLVGISFTDPPPHISL
ncbi:hypothetical protein PR202_ga19227 [Eleusine coracana subsp. coracana]|uniref:Uncharacterized protein n=1 Tax=Eleusine coracana subsp. coracana TaxID=191504 RepID=A0AAV5CV19_ELECO|nr:hypothetical protein PR202_ga19227 [Eleusine coracana subsp. coracana]